MQSKTHTCSHCGNDPANGHTIECEGFGFAGFESCLMAELRDEGRIVAARLNADGTASVITEVRIEGEPIPLSPFESSTYYADFTTNYNAEGDIVQ